MKKQLKEQTIQANRSKSNDVLALIEQHPNLKIEDSLEIKQSNAHCYVLCALHSHHNAMTGETKWSKFVFTKTEECWNALPDSDKTALRMAAAQKMVILHNPTLETEESSSRKSSDPIELSEIQKEDIKALFDGGTDLKGIATQLKLRQKDIQPYFDTLS